MQIETDFKNTEASMDNIETDDIDTEEEFSKITQPKYRAYAFGISSNLYDKLDKHLFMLKAIDSKRSRKAWVLEAIRERLVSENLNEDIPKERRLNISIDDPTLKKIDERVRLLKKFRTSYSKKQWILEAILDKLDKDNKKLKEQLKKLRLSENQT
jgi:hypothetical protein